MDIYGMTHEDYYVQPDVLDEWVKVALIQASLDWCNKRRKELGKKPLEQLPPGVPCDPKSCPCGAGTGLHVDAQAYELNSEGFILKTFETLPYLVRQFIDHFDKCEIPELLIEEQGG